MSTKKTLSNTSAEFGASLRTVLCPKPSFGAKGLSFGAKGPSFGAKGLNSGAKGLNSGAKGPNSGAVAPNSNQNRILNFQTL